MQGLLTVLKTKIEECQAFIEAYDKDSDNIRTKIGDAKEELQANKELGLEAAKQLLENKEKLERYIGAKAAYTDIHNIVEAAWKQIKDKGE